MNKFGAFFSVVTALNFGHASGAVELVDSYAVPAAGGAPAQLDGGAGPFGYEFDLSADFSAAGHDKLVFVYSVHDGAFAGDPPPTINVFYAGAPLNEAVFGFGNGSMVCAGVFYLDNVASDGVLRIELSAGNIRNYAFGLYALDGTKTGVQAIGNGNDPLSAATVTMTTASGFFVQEAVRNNQTFAADEVDDYETLYSFSVDSYRCLSQYQVTSSPGDYLAPINNGGVNYRRVVTAAFAAAEPPPVDLRIISFSSVGPNLWELELSGEPGTAYEFRSSTTLEFDPGLLVTNLTQGDPGDAGTIGGNNDSVLTTDGNGDGKVQLVLNGSPSDFVRAQLVPPLFSEDFEGEDGGGFTTANNGLGTEWSHGPPNSLSQGGGATTAGNGGSAKVWGTNLTGGYAAETDAVLRSPIIDLTGVAAAELSFALALDAAPGHVYQVDIIDDTTDTVLANVIAATGDGDVGNSDWEIIGPTAIPAPALGQPVRIQLSFIGDGDGLYNGAYIDDVLLEETAP